MPRATHREHHRNSRIGWLRAAVLGTNDGIVGINDLTTANPVQAALTSALTFSAGAALPLLAAVVAPADLLVPIVAGTSLLVLSGLGALSAYAGGAPILRATLRVAFWGALAMALTAGVGKVFGTVA